LNYYAIWLNFFREKKNRRATRTVEALIARGDVLDKIVELDKKIENNKRKKYYIIRKNNETIGLMTYVSLFIGQMDIMVMLTPPLDILTPVWRSFFSPTDDMTILLLFS
jgi:hypothetical protein